jgi:predicted transcriptional regulator
MMTTEFGEMKDVVVTPEMLNRYFFMNKTEILVHLFLLSVCDSDRHVERNVHALARETEIWRSDLYQALTRLCVKKMVEEKKLKTKGGRFWRVYPLPRTRKVNSEKEKKKPNSNVPQSQYSNSEEKSTTHSASSNQQGQNQTDLNNIEEKTNRQKNEQGKSNEKESESLFNRTLSKIRRWKPLKQLEKHLV